MKLLLDRPGADIQITDGFIQSAAVNHTAESPVIKLLLYQQDQIFKSLIRWSRPPPPTVEVVKR